MNGIHINNINFINVKTNNMPKMIIFYSECDYLYIAEGGTQGNNM